METPARPVQQTERIQSLDILRGWAVFGMLIVNIGYFSSQPMERPEGANAVAAVAVQILVSGKFWTLFSVFFGYGFALQFGRAAARGQAFVSIYLRRMVVLLLFGLAHALLHPSEILHRYALIGFLMIPLRHASTRGLIAVGVASLLVPLALPTGGGEADAVTTTAVYTFGTLPQVLAFNALRFARDAFDVRVLAPFPYFLLGLGLARLRLLEDLPRYMGAIRRWRWVALLAGLGLQASPVLMALASEATRSLVVVVVTLLMSLGSGLLGLFYAAVLVLWTQTPSGLARLRPFAAVGRLALTNYLMQTVVVTTLLYGYGFGLYGHLGVVGGLPIALGIYAGQVVASNWWIRRFRFGPVEWVWRSLAYGWRQPL